MSFGLTSDHYAFKFKYIIIGDSGVGKSVLVSQFTEKRFVNIFSTIGVDVRFKSVTIDDLPVVLKLCDTAGQEYFRSITRNYYREAAGALLVYDLTNRKSFENLNSWVQEIKTYSNNRWLVTMLVANKCDLEEERKVSYEEGVWFARQHGFIFVETSAKTSTNVEAAFEGTAKEIVLKMQAGAIDYRNPECGIKIGMLAPAHFKSEMGETNNGLVTVVDRDPDPVPERPSCCRRSFT